MKGACLPVTLVSGTESGPRASHPCPDPAHSSTTFSRGFKPLLASLLSTEAREQRRVMRAAPRKEGRALQNSWILLLSGNESFSVSLRLT